MQSYQIIKTIGNGAYGNVLLARHKGQDRQYAIKRIKFSDVSENDRIAIQNEVKILQTMKHPNLVPYKDSFMDQEGYLNIVLAYCEGGDMYKRIKGANGRNFPEGQVLDWLCQICLALYFMHDSKILHRDLKPQNIFLKNGRVLLGDFGISKILDETVELTSTCIGTPYYMSPDLYKYNKYSYKADIWALGCVLYELCNLRLPFEANNPVALSIKVIKGHYSPTTSTYSKPLRDLISKMLSLDAKQRPYIYEVLKRPFLRPRVQAYLSSLIRKAQAGEESREDLYLEALQAQVAKLGMYVDDPNTMSRITSTPSLKSDSYQEKVKGIIVEEQKEIELIKQELTSLEKDKTRDSQRRNSRKSVHELSSKRESSFSQDRKAKERSSIDRREKSLQRHEGEDDHVDHRQRVLKQKERKEKERRENYQKKFQELNRQNFRTRELASEKHRAQYRVSEPAGERREGRRNISIEEDKRMEQEGDEDYQEDKGLQADIYRIEEVEEEQDEDLQLKRSMLHRKLQEKTMRVTKLSEQIQQQRKEEEEEQAEQGQQRINQNWLRVNDRVRLLRHKCEVGIGFEMLERAQGVIARHRPEETREALVNLFGGESQIAFWHLISSLNFFENLQKSIPKFA